MRVDRTAARAEVAARTKDMVVDDRERAYACAVALGLGIMTNITDGGRYTGATSS